MTARKMAFVAGLTLVMLFMLLRFGGTFIYVRLLVPLGDALVSQPEPGMSYSRMRHVVLIGDCHTDATPEDEIRKIDELVRQAEQRNRNSPELRDGARHLDMYQEVNPLGPINTSAMRENLMASYQACRDRHSQYAMVKAHETTAFKRFYAIDLAICRFIERVQARK